MKNNSYVPIDPQMAKMNSRQIAANEQFNINQRSLEYLHKEFERLQLETIDNLPKKERIRTLFQSYINEKAEEEEEKKTIEVFENTNKNTNEKIMKLRGQLNYLKSQRGNNHITFKNIKLASQQVSEQLTVDKICAQHNITSADRTGFNALILGNEDLKEICESISGCIIIYLMLKGNKIKETKRRSRFQMMKDKFKKFFSVCFGFNEEDHIDEDNINREKKVKKIDETIENITARKGRNFQEIKEEYRSLHLLKINIKIAMWRTNNTNWLKKNKVPMKMDLS